MWQPVSESERSKVLDVVRGLALFGVLVMNLMSLFRISLFDYMTGNRFTGGLTGMVIDQMLEVLIESKAFIVFSILFGAGAAIQTERFYRSEGSIYLFLWRRYCVLLLFGAAHIAFLWNGDILLLYAACGLLLIPLLPVGPRFLGIVGSVLVVVPHFASLPVSLPATDAMKAHAAEAARVYGYGSFTEITIFRWSEFREFIVPLLVAVFIRTAGLMLIGAAGWRSGILANPDRHRRILKLVFMWSAAGAVVSHVAPLLHINALSPLTPLWDLGTGVLQAIAYVTGAFLWFTPALLSRLSPVGAVGRMALTNYLMQSLLMSVIFYGFGFGLFGKLTPAPALAIAVSLYAMQMLLSQMWLRRFRFGPMEWLWRSLTYGRLQLLKR